jgi:Spy/CpxP family protein refolding chaperone
LQVEKMKRTNFLGLILTGFLLLLAFSSANAQETNPEAEKPGQLRPFKLLQELGLTREQVQQIRRINQERRPVMQEAQQRWQIARRNLDIAIYADDSTDEKMRELTKQAQIAQGELLKERTITEFMIRKVLTPDQLLKFRNLRDQLIERMNNRANRETPENANDQPQKPLNRLQQRRNQNRVQ